MLQRSQLNRQHSDFVIETDRSCWIIPRDCELLKRLLEVQDIKAADLCFTSSAQCQCFIKQLFLLALQDQARSNSFSPLAELARELVCRKTSIYSNYHD